MNPQNNENEQPKVLLLEAPKSVPRVEQGSSPVEANEGLSEAESDPSVSRKYGKNTGKDYEVGKNKPPLQYQFQPGNSGKPLGARHFTTLFRDAIKEIGGTAKDGQKVPYDKIITKKIITMAADGNLKAATMVIDRVDGKVPQSYEVNKTERIGVYVMTPEEIEDHESIFKRQYVYTTTQNNNASGNENRNEEDPRIEEGGAYESR